MRITNKIVQGNSIAGINKNKIAQDKLNTQFFTGKKISRPSDDPVIAIRALRLRTSVTKISQYYERNVPDARSWLGITGDAVANTVEVLEDLYNNCTKGAVDSLKSTDRAKILEDMKALRDEVYSTGNSDYAGRYVFSGYRTDMPLTFKTSTTKTYTITEQLSSKCLEDIDYVNTKDLSKVNSANAETGITTTAQDVKTSNVHRIRLAYEACDKGGLPSISYYDAAGVQQTITVDQNDVISVYSETPNPYLSAENSTNGVTFIPETGELILSDAVYNKLQGVLDKGNTQLVDEGEIRITYKKSEWATNELRPEHYYACESDGVKYNEEFLTNLPTDTKGQVIHYDVGMNQSIRVNTVANEIYTPNVGRDVDELIAITEKVTEMEEIKNNLEKMVAADPDNAGLAERLEAVTKAFEQLNSKMQSMFESGITKMQAYQAKVSLAETQVGSRGVRLDLIENRLSAQASTFEILQSENEDVDQSEVLIKLTAAQGIYEASLMAVSKISQTSLLNYL